MKNLVFLLTILCFLTQNTRVAAQSCDPVQEFTYFNYNSFANTIEAEWTPVAGANSYIITLYLDNTPVQTFTTPDVSISIDLSPFGNFSEGYINVVSDCNPFEPLASPIFTKEIVIDDISMLTILKNGCKVPTSYKYTDEKVKQILCACSKLQPVKSIQELNTKLLEQACDISQECKVSVLRSYKSEACSTPIFDPTLSKGKQNITSSVSVTPNPSSLLFSLKWEMTQSEPISLFLYDNTGKMLETPINNQSYSEGTHQYELDLGAYPKGIYYYQLLQGKRQTSGKLIKLE